MFTVCAACGKRKLPLLHADFREYRGKSYCSDCLETAWREGFCQAAAPFFEAGLAREVFRHRYFSVCNLADTAYGLILYGNEPATAVLMAAPDVDFAVQSIDNALELVRRRADEDNACVPLSDELFEKLQTLQKKSGLHGPSPSIDRALEAQWAESLASSCETDEP